MAKIVKAGESNGQTLWMFDCPGCKCSHGFYVPHWTWNGSEDAPTFSPSLLCNRDEPERRCHSFVRDGKIQFLDDCWHDLRGQTVALPEQ